uniref:Uncharacterized protein n=1 Tax=Anguilla anguilla TaxID=7936 RepID=A0A0E9W494_ANGAN
MPWMQGALRERQRASERERILL